MCRFSLILSVWWCRDVGLDERPFVVAVVGFLVVVCLVVCEG